MLFNFFAKFIWMVLSLLLVSEAHAFDYEYEKNVLIVHDNGAWVKNGKKTVALIPQFNEGLRAGGMRGPYESMRKQAILVSLVGPYASFRVLQYGRPIDTENSAVARSEGFVYVHVIDIRNPNKPHTPVSLLDIFAEGEVRAALQVAEDEGLRKAYDRFDKRYDLKAFNFDGLPPDGDFLYEFFFDKVDRDMVDVGLQVHTPGFGDGVDGDVFYKLKLRVPTVLVECFSKATLKDHGYLSSNSFGSGQRPNFYFK